MIQGKVWGTTEPLLITPFCEMHRIRITAGAKCSKHLHRYRSNAFYVISGTLSVHAQKKDYDLIDETVLTRGQMTTIPPNEYHWFEAVTDVVALEIYYPSPCSADDIERENHGSAP